MRHAADLGGFPLSPAMARRVISYLNLFRLGISLALLGGYAGGALVESPTFAGSVWSPISLVMYLAVAMLLIFESRRKSSDVFAMAQAALLLDVVMISLISYLFGGVSSGLPVLLVFTGTAAAFLLPLNRALFIASLATLAIIGESILGGIIRSGQAEYLLRAGLYSLTLFVITVLTHKLARWARDYRLIAERQMMTLSRLEQINEVIIKRMRTGVLAVDDDGEIRMMNESAWFLLGSPPASRRMLEDVSPELSESLNAWRDDPREEEVALTLTASQAEVIPGIVALPAGREISTLIFLEDSDVVARRATEISAQSLAKLSSSIAHEIRNPLSAVSHAAQLLEESETLTDPDRRMLDIIGNQSRRMNEIVENILQMSRREKARAEVIDLSTWLQELTTEFNKASHGPDFRLKVEGNAANAMALFDRSQLHQVMWQLMENALQHLGEDNRSPDLLVRLHGDERTGYSIVSVEDNGGGIPADRIGEVFEPFFTTRKEGSGLGLYIARQLCESNHAELTVDSTHGSGTRFHIRTRLAAGDQPDTTDIDNRM